MDDKPTFNKKLIAIVKSIGDGGKWWRSLNAQQQVKFLDEAWALHNEGAGAEWQAAYDEGCRDCRRGSLLERVRRLVKGVL